MNIGIISYWTCPWTRWGERYAGGLNVYVVHLANFLAKLGHHVDIYTRTHKEREDKSLELHKNIKIFHFSQQKPDLVEDSFYFAQKILRKKRNYDIFHAHFYYSGLVGIYLRQKTGVPLLFTPHSLGAKEFDPDKVYSGRIEIEKKVFQESNGIIISSPFEKEDIEKYYQVKNRNIFIVPPGVNHQLFKKYNQKQARNKLRIPQDSKMILFVGRIDSNKRIGFLLQAVDWLIKNYVSLKQTLQVILIGGNIKSRIFWSYPEVKRIKKLIAEKNLHCCVKFVGSRPYTSLPYYYSAADIVVMPSLYESFGLVVLEAMACGASVVVSPVGGLRFFVENAVNGYFFEKDKVESLAKILLRLIEDKEERKKLGKNAILTAKKFSWETHAKEIVKIYRNYE